MMSKRAEAQWTVSGIVEAPVEMVWQALLDRSPDLSPGDKEALRREGGPDPFSTSRATPEGGQVHLEVSKRQHALATQGEWWYRGVYSVEPHERGSLLSYRVYNIAPGAGWWIARFIQGPQHARTMKARLQDQLRSIGEQLGCAVRLVAMSGGLASTLAHSPERE